MQQHTVTPTLSNGGSLSILSISKAFPYTGCNLSIYRGVHPVLPPFGQIGISNFYGITAPTPTHYNLLSNVLYGQQLSYNNLGITGSVSASLIGNETININNYLDQPLQIL